MSHPSNLSQQRCGATFLARAAIVGFSLGFALFQPALAQTKAPKTNTPQTTTATSNVKFFLGAGFTSGGDNLASGQYANGGSYEITAGGGADFKGGVEYRFTPNLALQGSVGHHSDSTSATNGSIKFKRTPIEVLGFYSINPSFRIGGGIRNSTSASFSSSGVANVLGSSDLSSQVGTVIQGDYFFTPKVAASLRLVNESFKRANGATVSGNHAGLYMFFYF